ncbi:MAG: TRAP transporter large permease subunit [Aminobacterium sp.]|jgi:C4-dicarboxylate transporter DctM subunit|uniref:TRAP transporter large permease n=1 Tax=unclassified Aminobacterium TaxID=2685012 RepID=UPI001BCFEDED|nr:MULTISPECIES: TRAP transporter large permease subunit [unclassified Aminobacterium]MDD2247617.1 TRAP transporter large permease subunit [Proteiniphilum sp.]MDD4229738.1 TRAP transporter large permease subunit [Aminobacterium sp.]MEA4876703.1 TRAP transporter large permease subunit [Aminobacterium sp.]WMI72196.1 TRAP transporter large permease subunit [Aminobacterium sp. MB27-C1]
MLSFLLVIALLIVVLFTGLPVAFSLGSTSVLLILLNGLPAKIVGSTMFSGLESFTLLSIPLFILMSQILLDGRVGDDLFDVMNAWVRHLPGGLAIATVLACAFFSAITGSGAATAATIGMVAYPAMIERGYDKKFTLGLLAAGGTLGILIPPSIPMILYGAITEESVGKLFIAGVVPGLILTAIFIIYAVFKSKRGGFTPMERTSWSERMSVTKKNVWGILLPLLIIGGIYSGVFTPTEAAAVGLIYSLFITIVIYKTIKLSELPKICLKSVGTSCMIAIIIAAAILFGKVMTMLMIPQKLTQLIIQINLSPLMFIIAMNLLMLILGMMLETVSIILLTMPLVTPILVALNIDPIWYAIILTVNMTMALITPPVGMNLYVINGLREDISMSDIIQGVWPFIILMTFMLILAMAFPQMSLWLPSIMH